MVLTEGDTDIANWTEGLKFHHNPEITNFRKYFDSPEWQDTIQNLKESGVTNLLAASGNGFRALGSYTFSDELGVPFCAVGKVEDELTFDWWSKNTGDDDVIAYQQAVVRGKFFREEVLANGLLNEGSLLVAMDEIILVWKDGNLMPMEKPQTKPEALEQIWTLTSGMRYIISSTTGVGSAKSMMSGRTGMSTHLLPMRIKCESSEEREKLFNHWVDLYEDAVNKTIPWKVTPGAIPLLHPDLQPYQEVRIGNDLRDGMIPDGFSRVGYLQDMGESRLERMVKQNRAYLRFADSLAGIRRGTPFLSLPSGLREEVGIEVGGLSLAGMREACERFLTMDNWVYLSSPEGGAATRATLFWAMMQPVVEHE